VVEHGLDHSAVITFLKPSHPYPVLDPRQTSQLLSISYNQLVDWHLFPDRNGITAVNNRTSPLVRRYVAVASEPQAWRAEAFARITGRLPNPNLKALDDALIDTVSFWKRSLVTEMPLVAAAPNISALFNLIIFVRAIEDQRRGRDPARRRTRILLDSWRAPRVQQRTLRECLTECLASLHNGPVPFDIQQYDVLLRGFDNLDRETVTRLLIDFYENRFVPLYEYDFSLISKHALSRLYEHYVSVLRDEDSPQLRLFKSLPVEERNRALGGVYTPQYIARFFARFLKENTTPRAFRSLKTIDPACGSGIFLRTILEMQCDPLQEIDTRAVVPEAFGNTSGIDIDPNACEATRLSLFLLHLVLTDTFPDNLNIVNAEAIEYALGRPEAARTYDAVIGNPPFIKWDRILPIVRDRVTQVMDGVLGAKPDMFLAMLKMGLEWVRPGGHLLYILPHSFLLAENAKKLRQLIQREFLVRVLADLSEIPVFENVGTYVILLVLQRKVSVEDGTSKATIVRCRDFVGHALQNALEGRHGRTEFYEVFEVEQKFFKRATWGILSADETALQEKLASLVTLGDVAIVREGLITGADPIFIRRRDEVPPDEKAVWLPLLTDREMEQYVVPGETSSVVFYPYDGPRKLTQEELENRYPRTWAYLHEREAQLRNRRSVTHNPNPWWAPVRPRQPSEWRRPKLVSPHLVVSPKFALDQDGKYAVSHSPFLYPKKGDEHLTTLYYLLAVLNSSVMQWQISTQSHKYSRGYLMMEPKTLKELRLPTPDAVPRTMMNRLQHLVRRRLSDDGGEQVGIEIDDVVAGICGLSHKERAEVGLVTDAAN
jgi:hypothetical protein